MKSYLLCIKLISSMNREDNQDILQVDYLLVKSYVRNLGYEVLLGADPDNSLFLEKEDLVEVARSLFCITDIPRLCKYLVGGEFFLISKYKLEVLQPIFENKYVNIQLSEF